MGKYLQDLTYEVETLRMGAHVPRTQMSISWQDDGTLCAFDPDDGYPMRYWHPGHIGDNKDDYCSLARFVERLMTTTCKPLLDLLTSPVWEPYGVPITEVHVFNTLLGDIKINL